MEELLDLYAQGFDLFSLSYEMMGKMLDKESLKKRLKAMHISDVYIYGGGYLGIQLYNAINDFINVLNVVDKSGKLLIDMPDITVINLEQFKSVYRQEKVIITPIKHYKSINMELSEFIPRDKMILDRKSVV